MHAGTRSHLLRRACQRRATSVRPTARTQGLGAGACVGPYRILGEIGAGGMGMVYRAVHALLDRPAAIKVLRPEVANDAAAIDRLLVEARAMTAIRHPGITAVWDYGRDLRCGAFIAMELLEGETLGRRIADRGALPLGDALAIARRIAAPLAAAHAGGIVHRDLKPDNVFLVRNDRVKLLDFGIARLDATPDSLRTTVGMVVGTPAYMSPEQCSGSGDCDQRADLYALGCILFEMLTGACPFGLLPPRNQLAAHVKAPVPDIAQLAQVPDDLARLVARLLAKSPDDRPRSALEVSDELAAIECRLAFATKQTARLPATALFEASFSDYERSVA